MRTAVTVSSVYVDARLWRHRDVQWRLHRRCRGRTQCSIRKQSGLDFLGFTYDEKFLVVSTPFPFEDVFDDFSFVNYVADPDEWCVVLRTDKVWRVLFPTTPETADDEALLLSDDFIQERLHHLYDKEGDYEIGHRNAIPRQPAGCGAVLRRPHGPRSATPATSTTRSAAWV